MTPASPGGHDNRRWLGELEPALRDRLLALDEPVSWERWPQVVRRSHRYRSPGSWITLAALLAASVLTLGAAAYWSVAQFAGAAPSRAAHGAQAQAAGTPAVASALLSDGDRTIYVSPSGQSSFCYRWAGSGGGCNRLDENHLWVTWDKDAVAGAVALPSARFSLVKITFTDGTTTERHVSWISAPLNAGFFVYEIPKGKTVDRITSGTHKGF